MNNNLRVLHNYNTQALYYIVTIDGSDFFGLLSHISKMIRKENIIIIYYILHIYIYTYGFASH